MTYNQSNIDQYKNKVVLLKYKKDGHFYSLHGRIVSYSSLSILFQPIQENAERIEIRLYYVEIKGISIVELK